MNPLFLWCFTEIYNPHQNRFFHLFFFCHRVLMSLQLKCPSALCLTLRCLFVWLINHNALSPLYKHYHPHRGYNTSPSHSNTTEWPNSITCPIYLCWGRLAPWLQCKSLVPVNNLFSHSSKGPLLSLDIRLAEERWMRRVLGGVKNRTEEGESEVVGLRNQKPSIYPMTSGHSSLWDVTC